MDEEEFSAPVNAPGQAESRAARVEFDAWLTKLETPLAWKELWETLRMERVPLLRHGELVLNDQGQARTKRRWDWRKAGFIAWKATPKSLRKPETFEQLADLLGCSTSTFRNWRRDDPGIDERIGELPGQMLFEHVTDVLHALTMVAQMEDPKAAPDRKLFLEVTRIYRPQGTVAVTGLDEGPVQVRYELGRLSDDELVELDRLAGRLAGATGGEGAAAPD